MFQIQNVRADGVKSQRSAVASASCTLHFGWTRLPMATPWWGFQDWIHRNDFDHYIEYHCRNSDMYSWMAGGHRTKAGRIPVWFAATTPAAQSSARNFHGKAAARCQWDKKVLTSCLPGDQLGVLTAWSGCGLDWLASIHLDAFKFARFLWTVSPLHVAALVLQIHVQALSQILEPRT